MKRWLKIWAAQAATQAEQRQRAALIESAYPHQRSSSFMSPVRRVGRGMRYDQLIMGVRLHD